MDEEARAHNESLLQIYIGHLRQLELMAAKYGDLAVPSHITLEIAEYRRKIAELEGPLRLVTTQQKGAPRHNLPPREYERFVGRQNELVEVRRLLQGRAYVITIDGIGGIGKSTLALETAYFFFGHYNELPEQERFEAIVWVSAKRTYLTASGIRERRQFFRTLEDVFAAIARVRDYPEIMQARVDEQHAIVEQVLREQRVLLILDNLETVDDEVLLDFLHELPEPTKAIVTTRHRIDVARTIRLTGMQHGDALSLIDQEARRKDVALSAEDRESLWQKTGGVPLAIVWSIGLMGMGSSIDGVLRRLSSGQSDIAKFCFNESVAQIRKREAYKLLLALSLFAADASRDALGVVAGLSEDHLACDTGLEDLLRLSLVNKEGDRFSLLPLTRNFASAEAAEQAEQMQYVRVRWQDYFYQLVVEARSSRGQMQDGVERELTNALAALKSMHAEIHYELPEQEYSASERKSIIAQSSHAIARKTLDFCSALAQICFGRGYWLECEITCHIAISIGKALEEFRHVGWRLYDLARISFERSDLEVAEQLANQAMKIWKPLGPALENCHIYRMIGQIEQQRGNINSARESFTQALKGYKQLRDSASKPYVLHMEAALAEMRGDVAKAEDKYRQAIAVLQHAKNIGYAASLLYLHGRLAFRNDDTSQAREDYKQSLEWAHDIHAANLIARNLCSLATLEAETGNSETAKPFARDALARCRRLSLVGEQTEMEHLLARLGVG